MDNREFKKLDFGIEYRGRTIEEIPLSGPLFEGNDSMLEEVLLEFGKSILCDDESSVRLGEEIVAEVWAESSIYMARGRYLCLTDSLQSLEDIDKAEQCMRVLVHCSDDADVHAHYPEYLQIQNAMLALSAVFRGNKKFAQQLYDEAQNGEGSDGIIITEGSGGIAMGSDHVSSEGSAQIWGCVSRHLNHSGRDWSVLPNNYSMGISKPVEYSLKHRMIEALEAEEYTICAGLQQLEFQMDCQIAQVGATDYQEYVAKRLLSEFLDEPMEIGFKEREKINMLHLNSNTRNHVISCVQQRSGEYLFNAIPEYAGAVFSLLLDRDYRDLHGRNDIVASDIATFRIQNH